MTAEPRQSDPPDHSPVAPAQTCKCVDWYSEGQARKIEVGGVEITVRFVGRKGRRGRICITAPAGAVIRSTQTEVQGSPDNSRLQ